MTMKHALISVADVVDSLKFDYDSYLVNQIAHRSRRAAMSTEFDHHPVMNALIEEIMTNGPHEDEAGERVVRTITAQGVDILYAHQMARGGLKQLISSIGTTLPDITFGSIEQGEMNMCSHGDLFVTYEHT